MKRPGITTIAFVAYLCATIGPLAAQDKPPAKSAAPAAGTQPAASQPAGDLAPLDLKLPKPAFRGTPKDVPPGANLEPPRKGPRPPLMAPKGTALLSAGKKVTASDTDPIIGSAKLITDGDKEAKEGSAVEFGPGLQWAQVDLGSRFAIHAVAIWHFHANARIYHDVVAQVSDDPDFVKDVKTIFNNDHDNSSGLGMGTDKEFWETYEGKLIEARGVVGRYVRCYSKGSTADDQNHYTEIEVYGTPAK